MQKEIVEKLASERNNPCVTITMNTHRKYPANAADIAGFKNLLEEAEERVMDEFGKRSVSELLEKIQDMEKEIDLTDNLDSLYVFLSNSTKKVIRSPLPALPDNVQIGESFVTAPLMKDFDRIEEYLILLFSQQDVKLFRAMNDAIAEKVVNNDFPFTGQFPLLSLPGKITEGIAAAGGAPQFLMNVQEATAKVHRETGMNCVVICDKENYILLKQFAGDSSMYYGYAPVINNDMENDTIATAAWRIVKDSHNRQIDEVAEISEVDDKLIGDDLEMKEAKRAGPDETPAVQRKENNY